MAHTFLVENSTIVQIQFLLNIDKDRSHTLPVILQSMLCKISKFDINIALLSILISFVFVFRLRVSARLSVRAGIFRTGSMF